MTRTPRLAEALQTVEASRAAGWPEPLIPYDFLITQETTASRLTHIGFIPGVLLDIASVKEGQRQAQIPPDVAATRIRLLEARQTISQERMAAGELQQELLLRMDALSQLNDAPPEQAGAQLRRLVEATHAGWDIRLTKSQVIEMTLGSNTHSMILSGNPASPEAIYTQNLDNREPHERFWGGGVPATPEWAGEVYVALDEFSFGAEFTADHLQQQLKYYEQK